MTEPSSDIAAVKPPARLFDRILRCIQMGQLVPGQHLSERDQMLRFGVSRNALRDELKLLAAQGIVTLTPHRGAFIAALDRQSALDLLEVLKPLCELTVERAALNCRSDKDRAAMLATARHMVETIASTSRADFLEARRQFYALMVQIGGNAELGRFIPSSRADLFRIQFNTLQTREQLDVHAGDYARIADAVVNNDPVEAVMAMRKHFERTIDALMILPAHHAASTISVVTNGDVQPC
ncbi:GntR family transcriptional regulator [Blastomonas sp.]|uniref:GntR family transcriptional regulator n=1 Tax=Blastomonas sp. TaxID=1909299 RepID=UPI00391B02D8